LSQIAGKGDTRWNSRHAARSLRKDGQDLQLLVEKAYPQLEAEACEQMALTQYLSQINNVQLAFSIKQQKPSNLDAAVTATLEMNYFCHKREYHLW